MNFRLSQHRGMLLILLLKPRKRWGIARPGVKMYWRKWRGSTREGIVIVEALSGKKFNISSNAGLIRSRKNLLLLKQSSDAKWTIPATYHDWQLGKYWKHCWTESQSISNLTQLSSFDNWTGNMAQFCHKAHPKNSPKHSKILQVHGSKGIAKTTGYKIMTFTSVLYRHKKFLCCSVSQNFFSPILRAYLSANLTANFLLFFLFM